MKTTRWVLFAAGCLAACSSDEQSNGSGTDPTGGKASASGGARNTAGSTSQGGKASTGGAKAQGGKASGGTATIVGGGPVGAGGAVAEGGSANVAGAISTGAISATGGAVAGGSAATDDGTPSIAGFPSSAGSSATGGTSVTGGGPATGGTTAAGSSATGGMALTGGNRATAGVTATGGATICLISSVIYPNGAPNPANACQACQPGASTTAWTLVSEGTSCASGQVCHSGTCQAGCWVGATYYVPDAANPIGGCWACKPGVSTTAWTTDGASCGCTGDLQTVQEGTRLCVANMVPIPASTNYNIDSTEVTRAQYLAWLATTTAATLSGQDATDCSWNPTFTPDAICMRSTYVCQGTACGNHPQVCVDWCDAHAYCSGVGKRLCGKIGGGPNLYADYATASASQWYNACSSAGAKTYPYGSTYGAMTCNGYEYWGRRTIETLAVGSLPGCQAASPYSGAYDLSGNVQEWDDSCDGTGQSGHCHHRGGSVDDYGSYYFACGYDDTGFTRNVVDTYIGFRCCSP